MGFRMATKLEKQYLSAVAGLGCIVCANNGHEDSPAEIHHLRRGKGISDRSMYWDCIPLCPCHHRLGDGTANFAGEIGFHASVSIAYIKSQEEVELPNGLITIGHKQEWIEGRLWEIRYGTEDELLEQVRGQLPEELIEDVQVEIEKHFERIQRSR